MLFTAVKFTHLRSLLRLFCSSLAKNLLVAAKPIDALAIARCRTADRVSEAAAGFIVLTGIAMICGRSGRLARAGTPLPANGPLRAGQYKPPFNVSVMHRRKVMSDPSTEKQRPPLNARQPTVRCHSFILKMSPRVVDNKSSKCKIGKKNNPE